ncbi:MAG: efflux RND transporter permease subunit, partial [Muribaculaceae bacterium]|nr:efflux RND transporter permease subunit [Muribaculaceae bacterium]
LEDSVFDNSVQETSGSYQVKMSGYNYDELESLAEQFRRLLLEHRRIKEVTINSEFSWAKDDYTEFYLNLDRDAMARCNISVGALYAALSPVLGRDFQCGSTVGTAERILMSSRQGDRYDVWALMNMPLVSGNKTFRLNQFATIEQLNAPRSIAKENQQYVLCLQYEYIGSHMQGQKVLEKDVEEFRKTLPMGYSINIHSSSYGWSQASANNYWLLLLVAVIIFWITAVLFNSLKWPLLIVLSIPLSFIGLFLGFYWTGMNFDQGGFAAFVLLCGITVNAAIYLISEYLRCGSYIRAFNAKIIPIFLTVVSTILGFIPFMVGPDSPEAFWFPLALGTICGLATSLLALILFLPLYLPRAAKPAL